MKNSIVTIGLSCSGTIAKKRGSNVNSMGPGPPRLLTALNFQ